MALPFTHGAVGYAVYEALRPVGAHRPWLAVAAVVLANAPDFDFLPGIVIGTPGAYHRGVTHTLAGVLLTGLFVWWAVGWWGRRGADRRRAATFAATAWASHLCVDYIAADRVAPHGARFLWPLSDQYYLASHPLFPEIIIDPASRGTFFSSLVAPATWPVWSFEVGTGLLLVAAAFGIGVLRSMRFAPVRELTE